MQVGDRLLCSDGREVAVEAVRDAGRIATVYNVEVEGDHTYFVGDESEWGFDVWVHNRAYAEANGDGSYDIVVKAAKRWSGKARGEANEKLAKLSAMQGKHVVHSPTNRSGSMQDAFRKSHRVGKGKDVDHIKELQLGGEDKFKNMWALDSSVNRSIGSQIHHAIKELAEKTPIRHIRFGE